MWLSCRSHPFLHMLLQTRPCHAHCTGTPRALAGVAGPKLLQKTNLQRGRAATCLWTWDAEKRETCSWRQFFAQCPAGGFSLTQTSSEYSPHEQLAHGLCSCLELTATLCFWYLFSSGARLAASQDDPHPPRGVALGFWADVPKGK